MEFSLNAITHGGAEWIGLKSTGNSITLYYPGDEFNQTEIKASEKGGTKALNRLREIFNSSLSLKYCHTKSKNRPISSIKISDILIIGRTDQCAITLKSEAPQEYLNKIKGCDYIHVYPEVRLVMSDRDRGGSLELLDAIPKDKKIVIHGLRNHAIKHFQGRWENILIVD